MRLNSDYIVRRIMDETVLVPTGKAAESLSGIITVNSVGAFIIERIDLPEDELVAAIVAEYDVTAETARADMSDFIEEMKKNGVVTE